MSLNQKLKELYNAMGYFVMILVLKIMIMQGDMHGKNPLYKENYGKTISWAPLVSVCMCNI